jgi:flagellar basal-body rod protein FlgB
MARMPLLSNPFGVHERALALRDQRSTILAANMANVDTPNYKARDINFREILEGASNPNMMDLTHREHMNTEFGASGDILKYRMPSAPSLNGNTVEMDVEQGQYADNAMRYQATLTFLNSKISGITKALRGE